LMSEKMGRIARGEKIGRERHGCDGDYYNDGYFLGKLDEIIGNEDNDGFDGLIDDNWNDINYDVDFDDEFYYDEDLEDDILLAEIFNVIYQDNKIEKNIQNSSKNIEKILLILNCFILVIII